ncbi:MAG TPA: class I SAM-dependent rRNA methyltransferase [Polyangiaceae bacterium]|nr:class I SAM-dependent rRNA methyltransferase [Polyangiaceae bacterium]
MTEPSTCPTLELPAQLKRGLQAGHPWVYRDHVPRGFQAPSGTWVKVRSGGFSAFALWDESSKIALRLFSERVVPDADWVRERVAAALELRRALLDPQTSAYRLLYGEGDGIPGLTVDVYGPFAVIVTYADSLDTLVPWVVQALVELLKLHGVVRRARVRDGEPPKLEALHGRLPPRDLIIAEHGLRMHVDLFSGQKTGLFLDHRENRRFLGALCAGKRVLNLFSYTGAFSLYAARAGATRVTSVDLSQPAARAARGNFELNGLDPEQHEFLAEDVFEFLERTRQAGTTYDVVICDPPSFANSRDQQKNALRAYVSVNSSGLRVLAPGGIYAAASCTAQVSSDAFRGVLAEAAVNAKRRLQIFHDAGHAPDHPIFAGHPEGRYLKFMAARALPIA